MKCRTRRQTIEPVRFETVGPSKTQQEFSKCNPKDVIQKFEKTGILEYAKENNGNYGHFLDAKSYHEALNSVISAQDAFMNVPSDIRQKFHNDPAQFLEFVQDPKNIEEMISLGLATSVAKPESKDEKFDSNDQKPVTEGDQNR